MTGPVTKPTKEHAKRGVATTPKADQEAATQLNPPGSRTAWSAYYLARFVDRATGREVAFNPDSQRWEFFGV